MEIGEIRIRVQFGNIYIHITDGMCTIYYEHDAFLLEESLKGIDGENDAWHGANVINHYHLDFLGIAVHKFLHPQLDALCGL